MQLCRKLQVSQQRQILGAYVVLLGHHISASTAKPAQSFLPLFLKNCYYGCSVWPTKWCKSVLFLHCAAGAASEPASEGARAIHF